MHLSLILCKFTGRLWNKTEVENMNPAYPRKPHWRIIPIQLCIAIIAPRLKSRMPLNINTQLTNNGTTIERKEQQELKDCYRTSRHQLERNITRRVIFDFIRCEGGRDAGAYCGIEEGCLFSFTHL